MILYYSGGDYPFFQETYLLDQTNIMLSFILDQKNGVPQKRFQRLIDAKSTKSSNRGPRQKDDPGNNHTPDRKPRKHKHHK